MKWQEERRKTGSGDAMMPHAQSMKYPVDRF